MKIRYLLLHAYGTGGTTRTVLNQANAMAAAGHDVELVSVLRRRDDPRFWVDPRVSLTALVDERQPEGQTERQAADAPEGPAPADGARGTRGGGLTARYRSWRQRALRRRRPAHIPRGEFGIAYFDRFVERTVAGYLRRLRDGVLVSTRPALNILVARYAGGGVILVAQEHINLATHRGDVRAAIARSYPRFDAVVVLTQRDRADYQSFLPGSRILRIPNAVHTLDQVPSTHRSTIVAAAGRLFPQKGFDLLIPAFGQVVADHPDWQLRIYGTGWKKDELRALIEEHHLYNNVFLMGHTERLDDELAKASFFVLSSRFEGLPIVLIEAMSHALPAVSFDCPTGPADVITDGVDGFLVPPDDVAALADAMRRLVRDQSLRADLGAAAAKAASAYAPDEVHPQWEALFTELAAERAGAR